jgi:hypothetical protein
MEDQRTFSISGQSYTSLPDTVSPKRIRLLDAALKTVRSFWTQDNKFTIEGLQPGLYELWVRDTTGEESFMTVDLSDGPQNDLIVGKPQITSDQFHISREFRLPRKSFGGKKNISYFNYLNSTPVSNSSVELGIIVHEQYKWTFAKLPLVTEAQIKGINFDYSFRSGYQNSFLSVSSRSSPRKLICLPPEANIHLRFKRRSFVSDDSDHSIDVMVSTDYQRAEALLDMINSGAMLEAKSFVNAQLAEDLLQSKINNAWAAAIGGYYLLKVKDNERLHDWANNLANWFEWFPDGAIIHAWQMIAENDNEDNQKLLRIKRRLLEGQKRGLPLFTEGLRLLLDGLSQLSTIYKRDDKEVERALNTVKSYAAFVDWDCKYLTINNLGGELNGWVVPDYILYPRGNENR